MRAPQPAKTRESNALSLDGPECRVGCHQFRLRLLRVPAFTAKA